MNSELVDARSHASAILNILEDFAAEKRQLDATQRAVVNILEDSTEEKLRLDDTQSAMLNILQDAADERIRLGATQKAILNVLDDSTEEKGRLGDTQRAALNILDDFDIEKKKVEQVNADLHNEIAAHTRAEEALQRAKAAAEEASRELEAFSYSVAHDLRTPLRHISGYIEMLAGEAQGELSPEARRYLKTITDSCLAMTNLIDDLLAFSRMGRADMHESTVALDTLVATAISDLEVETRGRNIVWTTSPLPLVMGDRAMLKQVLTNLLGNAVKYTRPRDPARIEIGRAGEEDGKSILFVRDNGVGFDMKYADNLFGVFQRLHRADQFEGTGIGLANAKRIVVRHGGRIWAEATLDQGATFYFTLRALQSEKAQRRGERNGPTAPNSAGGR